MQNTEAQNKPTLEAIVKNLQERPLYGRPTNPDILFCITTEDVVHAASEQGIVLTLEEARAIGNRAFKHFSSEDIMCMVAEVVEEHGKEKANA